MGGRASPHGFEKGLNQIGFGLNPLPSSPSSPPPSNQNGFGFNPPLKPGFGLTTFFVFSFFVKMKGRGSKRRGAGGEGRG